MFEMHDNPAEVKTAPVISCSELCFSRMRGGGAQQEAGAPASPCLRPSPPPAYAPVVLELLPLLLCSCSFPQYWMLPGAHSPCFMLINLSFLLHQLPDQWEKAVVTVSRPGRIAAGSRCGNTVPDDDNQVVSLPPGSRLV